MTSPVDVIVVDGGHNGLVCACYLARAGLRVRVFERRAIVVGAAVTEEFHPGFRNSTASYTVGLLAPEIIRDLRLKSHGLCFVTRPQANFLPLSASESLSIYNDDAATAREFARFSSNDGRSLEGFRAMVREVGDVVRRQMRRTPPNVGGGVMDWLNAGIAAINVAGLSMERRRDLTVRQDLQGSRSRCQCRPEKPLPRSRSLRAPRSRLPASHPVYPHGIGNVAHERGPR